MPTFKEQLDKLVDLKHRLAVWEEVYNHLDTTFIAKDGRGAQRGIRVPDCSVELVQEEAFEEVLQVIGNDFILSLKSEIAMIEEQEVVVLDTKVQAQA